MFFCVQGIQAQALSVSESFEYEESDLFGFGEDTLGWAGSWTATLGAVEVKGGNLKWDTQGRHIETVEDLPGGEIGYFRDFETTWPDAGSSYWLGFMFHRMDDGTLSSWGGLSLMLDNSELLFMGSPWQQQKIGIDCMGIQISSDVPDTVESWIVARLGMNGTADRDTIHMWVNPDPSVEPDTALAAGRGDWNGSQGFNRIRIGADPGYVLAFDGIRLGETFEAIRPGATGLRERPVHTTPVSPLLLQNYPNPFNPSTRIRYAVGRACSVRLTVHDVSGRTVAALASGHRRAGFHEAEWNAEGAPAGVYLLRLETGSEILSRKMLLAK
jgi:hypothetical protein